MSTTVTYKGDTLTTATNQTKILSTAGKYMEGDVTITDVTAASPTLQTITKTYTPTESQQTETITAGSGYDGIEEVDVTVNAISSSYVGSGVARKSSTDLTASGATVTAPAGYYASDATKTVASGTEGTPTATKGTVSNHAISVTPSVTNTAGYISGGTHTGTAVSVSASELVSGTYTVDSSGNKDVTNYATVNVPGAVPYISFHNNQYYTDDNQRWWKITSFASVDESEGDTQGWLGDGYQDDGEVFYTRAVPANTTITPSTSSQTVGGANYMMEGAVTVAAMPSGTTGTPTATKGTVSNHQVSVTPSVTNSTGYITGGTKTGTAVTVQASELVSGTYTVSGSGTADVTNYANISVPDFEGEAHHSITFRTQNNQRKCNIEAWSSIDTPGFVEVGTITAMDETFDAVPSNTTITPTTSSQTIGGTNYMMEGAVTVSAMPSGTAGTPTATKGTVSNHSVSVTPSVTNTTGYITGSTKTGTAVTVSASELVSGTYNVTSSGTHNVTNYASASVSSMSLPINSSPSGSGTKKATITPSIETTYLNIPTGYNDTAQYYEINPIDVTTKSITENGTYFAYMDGCDGYSSVTVNVSGGGSSSIQTDSVEGGTSSASTLSFTGLKGEPNYFAVNVDDNVATGTPSKIVAVVYDGTSVHAQTITNTSNAQVSYDSSGVTYSYNNGTLTLTSTSASFVTNTSYFVDYVYGGSSTNVDTVDVQVGSGATSITFTGLEDEPVLWSCIFKSNFATSSGYQRVIFVEKTTQNLELGYAMDSSAHISNQYWSASYNNGSLTITSQGTNAGGYFHQPGYYQLTYVLGEASPYQKKTVTPTTSQQVIEPDTGYDALSQVTVQAIPNTYVQPTSTVGSTTYRASTSNQTINAGTYHSAAATIAAVSQTNLSAENIKSGTTISISNGQSNLWSVTGTYTGSGGGGGSVGTGSVTNSSAANTSISFTNLSGTPKAFFVRFTGSLTRSSNSSYYYITAIRYNGTNTNGNYWRMSNGTFSNDTTHYSYTYSNGTLTVSSSASRSAAGGSFYNGTYELTYFY